MTSQLDRDLLMQECRKLQWLAQYKCRRCLDSGIIYHRNGTDEPCDKCEKFNQRLEQDRAQLPEQAAATQNSNSN